MPTQLHAQARMMHYLAIVTSLVTFFRTLGGIIGLTVMSSVVNNKISESLPSGDTSASFNSLTSISQLPPAILALVQNAFADAIHWAYIAILPFACLAAIGAFFLRDVKIEKTPEERAQEEQEKRKTDPELGKVPATSSETGEHLTPQQPRTHRPRVKVYGPIMGIIWLCQFVGDKMGWRK